MGYPVEEIPKDAVLFKWFPRSKYDASGRPHKTAYLTVRGGMSTSWGQHCTAEECRAACKQPHRYGVVALHVECIESEPHAMVVRHTPKDWPALPRQAQAHTDVLMLDDDLEQQSKLYHLAVPTISPDAPRLSESEVRRA
jgi:hypothetical protein